jgi:DNA repair exonuclease SbcCD ATPase subunit
MKIKHRVTKEFQFLTPDKKIFVLKSGTILEEYTYKVKGEVIDIERDIIDNNPDYFELIDWKNEMLSYMKINKLPQPAQLGKKLIPFVEELLLSVSNKAPVTVTTIDENLLKEVESKKAELDNREKRIKDKEEEIDIRISRVERREIDHKEDLKALDRKEDLIREQQRDLTNREIDLSEKMRDLNERERNLEKTILESSEDIDSRYTDLKKKIENDLRVLSEKEKELELLSKELKNKEQEIEKNDDVVSDKIRNYEIKLEELKHWENDLKRLDSEIKNWEALHWKLKRMQKPPSAIE